MAIDARKGEVGHYVCRCGTEHATPYECLAPEAVLAKVKYKDWVLLVSAKQETNWWLQWRGISGSWRGRKWKLYEHMTPSELVQTAFKAALVAEEHECREAFTYKGAAIFGPHFHIDALVELCEQGKLDVRQERS